MTKVTKPKAGVKHITTIMEELKDFFVRNNAERRYKRYYLEFNRYSLILDGSMVFIDDEEDVIGVHKPTIEQVKALIYGLTGKQLE